MDISESRDNLNRTLSVPNSRQFFNPLAKLNLTREQRKAKFEAIARLKTGDPDAPDYYTGRPSEFQPAILAIEDEAINSHFAGAPQMRTWQLQRTVPKN